MRRNPFKTLVITGVPGVGKTTVINILLDEARKQGMNVMVANFGDYMLEEAVRQGLAGSRDELRRLPHRRQLELQKLAAQAIIGEAKKRLGDSGVLIVDTHSVVKTSTGYWPGLPKHVVEELNPDSIVIIEANPEEILARREKDPTRYRKDLGGKADIEEMLMMARTAALASATLTASSVFIVRNPEGRPEEAARLLLELISRL